MNCANSSRLWQHSCTTWLQSGHDDVFKIIWCQRKLVLPQRKSPLPIITNCWKLFKIFNLFINKYSYMLLLSVGRAVMYFVLMMIRLFAGISFYLVNLLYTPCFICNSLLIVGVSRFKQVLTSTPGETLTWTGKKLCRSSGNIHCIAFGHSGCSYRWRVILEFRHCFVTGTEDASQFYETN